LELPKTQDDRDIVAKQSQELLDFDHRQYLQCSNHLSDRSMPTQEPAHRSELQLRQFTDARTDIRSNLFKPIVTGFEQIEMHIKYSNKLPNTPKAAAI